MLLHRGRLDNLLLAVTTVLPLARGISVNLQDVASIKSAARIVAEELVGPYNGTKAGQPIGLYGEPYNWWESGAVWSGLIDYQVYTSDDQFSNTIQQALLAQVGPSNDYRPPNQTKTEGNDDQGMWALAAMNAAERNLSTPSDSPAWIDLAKNVFDNQAARWDTKTCGGGLRWQIYYFNNGYGYKNTVSQATFFLLAARLAKYTNNSTYVDWAAKAFDWTTKIGLIDDQFRVFDGVQTADGCDTISRLEWSYNFAAFMYGSAVLYNHTNGDQKWQKRTQSLASSMSIFYEYPSNNRGIMVEVPCEPQGTCNTDQYAFKGLASQWIGGTTRAAPFANDVLIPRLRASAKGAAQQCSGGAKGTTCGFNWNDTRWDGSSGVGQQLSAMNVLVANLMADGVSPNTTSANGKGPLENNQTSGKSSGAPLPTSSGPVISNDAAPPTMPLLLFSGICVGVAALLSLV